MVTETRSPENWSRTAVVHMWCSRVRKLVGMRRNRIYRRIKKTEIPGFTNDCEERQPVLMDDEGS